MTERWPVQLQQGPLLLRPLRVSDARAWRAVRARNAQWLGQWDATPPPGSSYPSPSFRQLARRLRRNARRDQGYPFVIEVSGLFAGQVTINNVVRGSAQFASIGYWIDSTFAGRGYMPMAVAMVIDHAFGGLGLHRVEICIRPENTNSLRVVEKLGLREIGYAPKFLHINGAWRDHRIFAVTAEEVPEGLVARLLAGPAQAPKSQ